MLKAYHLVLSCQRIWRPERAKSPICACRMASSRTGSSLSEGSIADESGCGDGRGSSIHAGRGDGVDGMELSIHAGNKDGGDGIGVSILPIG